MGKGINKSGEKKSKGISPLHFFGERNQPEGLEKLLDRRSIHGDGKIPAGLHKLKTTTSIFLNTEKGFKKPDIKIQELESHGSNSTWKIELPVSNKFSRLGNALFGRTASRGKIEVLRKQTDPKAAFGSYRPSWSDGAFSPKIMTQDHFLKMRRFNKTVVNPLTIYGTDDRWTFRDAAWPWGLPGKIFTSNGWTGSAALIGDRLIATASHLIPWHDNPWWIRFVPAFYDDVSLHGAGVESYVSDVQGYDVDKSITGYDWAVCRLYEPLGSYLGYFGYNGYIKDWEKQPFWSIIGYPDLYNRALRPSFQGSVSSDGSVADANGGLEIETMADITWGNSGGPAFGWWNGDPRLIGVVSGEETHKGYPMNIIAGGAGFTNLMAWGRTNWPL